MPKIKPFLMFTGQAEEALNFYTRLFPDSQIVSITRFGEDEGGAPGSVKTAVFTLHGQMFMAIDSPPVHEFTFTPSLSLFVDCDTEMEIEGLFAALSEGGEVLMPLEAYPFSPKYAWVSDRFGVSWQLSLVQRL